MTIKYLLCHGNNVPSLPSPELTDIAMLPPEPDTDNQLTRSVMPLSPTLTLPVSNDRSPDTVGRVYTPCEMYEVR